MVKRNQLRPGQVFGVALYGRREALIVVDGKTEVGFWDGGLYNIGDIKPSEPVEVLS